MTEASLSQLLPNDEFNAQLADNVHPTNWDNPIPTRPYHLVVIGAGTAGLVTAAGAAGLGVDAPLHHAAGHRESPPLQRFQGGEESLL